MIINWKKEKAGLLTVSILGNGGVITDTIRLLPGYNEVKDEHWNSIESQLKDKIETGQIEVVKVEVEKEVVKEDGKKTKSKKTETKLKEIPAEKAIEIIKDTYDLDTLNLWRKEESRDEVRAVLAEQIESVLNPAVKGKKDKK